MAEGLKVMAIEGHGIAFLPLSAVKGEVRARKLVSAAPADLDGLEMVMDVRLYRQKPQDRDGPRRAARVLWNHLQGGSGEN